MAYGITQNLQLEIIPGAGGGKILVPGCEPTTSLSSKALSSYLAKIGCGSALVDVSVALEHIPGSYIKFGINFNRGYRQKWFVLPPIGLDCPCEKYEDFYKILKSLANTELPLREDYSMCDINGMGFCPSPDFDTVEPPPASPYQPEGTFPEGAGVLPPVPPWALPP